MATPDMDVIKEIPGYKVILKAVLKSQIQQLVEQLATTTDEESVILTASVGDGTLSHLGSDSGKTFLEDHEDIKSQFLGFCLKRHHKQKQEKMEKERQEALARVAPVTPPRYGGMGGPRASYMPQRSPRFTSPRNQGPHPVALSRASTGALRNSGQGGARHEPYPTQRAPRRGSLSFDQGPGPRPNVGSGGQVIKVEPTDDEQSNQSAPGMTGSDTAQGSSEPSSPSVNQTGLQQSTEREDDAKSESSSSTIPNESSDLKQTDNVPPGGLSLGSDLSSLIPGVATTTSESVHDTSGMDPNVSVKLEAGDDGDMDLEITGVELGSRPGDPVMASSQDWAQQAMGGMPTGASGGPGDMTAQQGYTDMVTVALNKARYGGGRPSRPDHINEFPELLFCKTCCVFADYNEMVEKKDKLYRYCCPTCGDPLRLKFQGKQCGFFCRFCGRRVRDICDLKKHERTHTGEKPYHCTTCDRRFSQISNWKGHRCEILVSGANMDYMPLALAKIENNQNTSGKNMCYVPLSIVKSDAQNSGGVNISTEHGSVVTKVGQVSTTIDEDEMPAADSNAQQGDIDKDVQLIIANIKAQHSKNDTWSAAVSNSETEQMVGNEDDSVQLVITSIESQGSNVETLDMQVVQTDSE